jgi:hypothetical protein
LKVPRIERRLFLAACLAAVFFARASAAQYSLGSVIEGASKEQARIEKEIRSMEYTAQSVYVQKDKSGTVKKRIVSRRVISQKNSGETSDKYLSMNIDGKELSAGEMARELKKQRAEKREAKSPFSPKVKDSYVFTILGETEPGGRSPCGGWVVGFKPKEKKDGFIEGRAYVSAEDYSIQNMDFLPAKLPGMVKSMEAHVWFAPVRKYWLPSRISMKTHIKISFLVNIAEMDIEMDQEFSDYKLN